MEKCNHNEFFAGEKCKFPEGMNVFPDGENELDPCLYEDVELHTNVNVIVSRCTRCGHMILSWMRTDNTEDIALDYEDCKE